MSEKTSDKPTPSVSSTDAVTPTPVAPVTPVAPAVFNPFVHLSTEHIASLAARFTPAWIAAHNSTITFARAEYSASDVEACFFAELFDEAEKRIVNAAVKSATDTIINTWLRLSAYPGANGELAIANIVSLWNVIPTSHKKTAGVTIRDAAYAKMPGKAAEATVNKVATACGCTEKEWMRDK